MNIFSFFDKLHFLQFSMWEFSFNSLKQSYGRDFIRHIIIRHPLKTVKGIILYQIAKSQNKDPEQFQLPEPPDQIYKGKNTIIGVGYCMKPSEPICISGRGNHECWFFETRAYQKKNISLPESCKICPIKKIGFQSLLAGCNFYIMTSAIDILYDLYLPSLNSRTFTKGIFTLCRYSFEPFAIACAIAEIQGIMIPFSKNDCADYKTWLHADDGLKEEQTELQTSSYAVIINLLKKLEEKNSPSQIYKKQGNIFFIQ